MSNILNKVQKASVNRLKQMVQQVIKDTERQVVDSIGGFKALSEKADGVFERFVKNLNDNFDELMDREVVKDQTIFSFETLSLVQEEELDVIVALEGMVNAARNEHLPVFISFNARLSSMFPRKRIDESSNPLDPEQIATAFQEALRPLGMDAQNSLTVYRAFNATVLKKLDVVLNEANQILIESNVIPNLGMESPGKSRVRSARHVPRSEISAFGTVEEEAFDEHEERPELFSIMQNLLHFEDKPAATGKSGGIQEGTSLGGSGSGFAPSSDYMVPSGMIPHRGSAGVSMAAMQPFQPQEGQTVQMVDQAKLMEILTSIQERLSSTSPGAIPGSMAEVEKLNISQSLGEILKSTQQGEGVVSAVDRQSSDIINLVTLLYEAIWQDPSVPIPIKELIGRTQVTIIKVALADVEFFNNENHPARAILNEFAAAGIGWTEVEALEKDPLYQMIKSLVDRILVEYTNNNGIFEELIADFRAFKAEEAAKSRQLEQRILKATERNERLDDIHELVTQKIDERILGRELHEFVEELLKGPFHKFMVMLVLKEGPRGNAWKQAINTIDVLLWTVQAHEQDGDRERLGTVNPRLLNNLRKAFRIASIAHEEIDQLINQLETVQAETFLAEEDAEVETEDQPTETASEEPSPTAHNPPDKGELSLDASEVPEQKSAIRFHAADKPDAPAAPVTAKEDAAKPATSKDKNQSVEFTSIEAPAPEPAQPKSRKGESKSGKSAPGEPDLEDDDPHMIQVDHLAVGMWVEFAGEADSNTRCKLAAKIKAIDKFIFVNRQGVKVVEKTKMGLARELRDGTVSIISDGLLFSRALESVIGNLRESKHEQDTGGAYQRAGS